MAEKPNITWIGSPNFGYPNGTHGRKDRVTERVYPHKAIVYHIMAGTLWGTASHFRNPTSGASTHFGIGKNGEIHQYVDLNDAPYANGAINKPSWSGLIPDGKGDYVNPNLYTISIEQEGNHPTSGYWEPTEAQYQASLALTKWLCAEFDIIPSKDTLIGHNQIDSVNRPFCPGPGFPFKRLLEDLKPKELPRQVKHNGEVVECAARDEGGTTAALIVPIMKQLKGRVLEGWTYDEATNTVNITSRPERAWWRGFLPQ